MIQRAWNWLKIQFEPKPDPCLEAAVDGFARQVAISISEARGDFDFAAALTRLGAPETLDSFIADRTYRLFLRRAWKDGRIDEDEKKTLPWLASKLKIQPNRAREIDHYVGNLVFRRLISAAVEDGALDREEHQQLAVVAASLQRSLAEMAYAYLAEDGQALIELVTSAVSASGVVDDTQWTRLIKIVRGLGLSESQFFGATQAHVAKLVANVLERVTADSVIEESELSAIRALLRRLRASNEVVKSVEDALARHDRERTLHNPSIDEIATALNGAEGRDLIVVKESAFPPLTDSVHDAILNTHWWQITHSGAAVEKYSGGATRNVARAPVKTSIATPRRLRWTDGVMLTGGFGSLYFFACGALGLWDGRFVPLEYASFERGTTRFVDDSPSSDAVIVGHTWLYVNRSGEPDRRFAENRQIPVCNCGSLVIPSASIELQCSNPAVPQLLPA